MLEGKELEGKLGDVGNYSVDVDVHGKVAVALDIGIDKEVAPGVKAHVKAEAGVELDVADLLLAQAAKSDNKVLKFLAEQAAKLKAGEEVHPDVAAAAGN